MEDQVWPLRQGKNFAFRIRRTCPINARVPWRERNKKLHHRESLVPPSRPTFRAESKSGALHLPKADSRDALVIRKAGCQRLEKVLEPMQVKRARAKRHSHRYTPRAGLLYVLFFGEGRHTGDGLGPYRLFVALPRKFSRASCAHDTTRQDRNND